MRNILSFSTTSCNLCQRRLTNFWHQALIQSSHCSSPTNSCRLIDSQRHYVQPALEYIDNLNHTYTHTSNTWYHPMPRSWCIPKDCKLCSTYPHQSNEYLAPNSETPNLTPFLFLHRLTQPSIPPSQNLSLMNRSLPRMKLPCASTGDQLYSACM